MTARPPAPQPDPDAGLYTTAEVAALFAVDPGTVKRWAREGRIPAAQMIVTPGGRRRFDGEYIRSLLAGDPR